MTPVTQLPGRCPPKKCRVVLTFDTLNVFFWMNGNKQEVGGLKDNSNRYLSYLDFRRVGQEESQSFFFSPCIWVRFPIWPILLQIGWHNTQPSRGLSSIILRRLLNFLIVNSGGFFFPQLSHFPEESEPNHPSPTSTPDVHIDSFSSYEKRGFFKALFQVLHLASTDVYKWSTRFFPVTSIWMFYISDPETAVEKVTSDIWVMKLGGSDGSGW